MNSVVCTLFEGNFHYGLAGLTNSLYHCGYKGSIYAGYKGELPFWCSNAKENNILEWEGGSTLEVAEGLAIHFLPLTTDFHLTNYKPNFMLRLWDGPAKNADSIAYFDPDIIVKCKWSFFETWMSAGVALVHEVIANDMPPTHPLRREWEKIITQSRRETKRQIHSYINGGFCGVTKENKEFLNVWIDLFNTGIRHSQLTPQQWRHSYDRTYIFFAQDQDVLNIAAMCCECPISEMGPEAMDFIHGGTTMSHSAGSGKPWRKKFLNSVLKGNPPSTVDKLFWLHISSPISCYSSSHIKIKRLSIMIASFVGRFYRRY